MAMGVYKGLVDIGEAWWSSATNRKVAVRDNMASESEKVIRHSFILCRNFGLVGSTSTVAIFLSHMPV